MSAPTPHNRNRTFALICVAITSAWMIVLTYWLIDLLSGNDWCAIAVGVSKAADARPIEAITSCFSLLDAQVEALARSLLLSLGTLALCLLVLMVIVVADGRLSVTASKSGVSGNISREEPDPKDAAQFVANVAQEAADKVPAKPAVDDPPGGA